MNRIVIFILLALVSPAVYGQNPTAITKQFIQYFNAHDVSAMMRIVTDDVKWLTVSGEKISIETADKASLKAFLEGYFKSFPSVHSHISNLSHNGNRISMTETASWETKTGSLQQSSFVVYEFESGKIKRAYYYAEASKTGYDETLAKKLGADERGMKTYVFVNLIRGKKNFEKDERERLIAGHMENIGKLAAAGKLVLAGPFFDDKDIRGIYIFDVDTLEKARALTETDPAVKAGVFEFDMRLWYGSAALLELVKIHNSLQKPPSAKKD